MFVFHTIVGPLLYVALLVAGIVATRRKSDRSVHAYGAALPLAAAVLAALLVDQIWVAAAFWLFNCLLVANLLRMAINARADRRFIAEVDARLNDYVARYSNR